MQKGSPKARVLVRVIVGVTVLGCSLLFFQILKSNRALPAQAQDRQEGRLVEVMPARYESVARSFNGHGTTAAERSSLVAAQLTARVIERPESVRVGSWVDAQDILFLLEINVFAERVRSLQANVEALLADLDTLDVEMESTQERIRLSEISIELIDREIQDLESAVDRGGAMRIEVDRLRRQKTVLELERESLRQNLESIPSRRASLESRVASQRAELALAEIDRDRTTIQSPITGYIAELYVDEGDSVAVGQSVARIVDLRRIEIPLRMPSAAANTVRRGDRAVIRDSTGQNTFEGVVTRIAPEVDPNSRTISGFVEVEQEVSPHSSMDPSSLLLPGQFVSGEVKSDSTMQAILVPRAAIRGDRVMIVDTGSSTAQPRSVEVQYFTEREADDGKRTQWAVLSPTPSALPEWMPPYLNAGDSLIVSNLDGLSAGTPVRYASESSDSR